MMTEDPMDKTSAGTSGGAAANAAFEAALQDHIGRQLRAIYQDIVSQPVPERFLELLDKLENKPDKTA
jgi:hypothetical protein